MNAQSAWEGGFGNRPGEGIGTGGDLAGGSGDGALRGPLEAAVPSQEELLSLTRRLVEAWGPSGREDEVRDLIRRELEGKVDEIFQDTLGNLVAVRHGRGQGSPAGPGHRIMVAAHMDEIGVIVTYIDEKGFLRFAAIGGLSPFNLLGERVRFANGTIGVVSHEKLDSMKDLALDKMYIDIGAASRAEAQARVKIGDSAVVHRELSVLRAPAAVPQEGGAQGSHAPSARVAAKSLDDRIGCVVAIAAAQALARLEDSAGRAGSPNEVAFVFSTQEEVGARGAGPAAYRLEPDLALAVDVTATGDTPEARRMAVCLGAGPAVKVKDRSLVAHPKVTALLQAVAAEEGLPCQPEILEYGGTDAGAIHTSRSGVPSGVISIPCRYVHSPSEVVDLGDVRAAAALLAAVARKEVQL